MKKLFFTIVAAIYATSLFAQQASKWSLSTVNADVKPSFPYYLVWGHLLHWSTGW